MTELTLDQIDGVLAERVMGLVLIGDIYYKKAPEGYKRGGYFCKKSNFHPSRSLPQAFMVQAKMMKLGFDCYLNLYADDIGNNVKFYRHDAEGYRSGFKQEYLAEELSRAAYAALK